MDLSVVHGSVVVGVDGSAASRSALTWARRQAALAGRPLTVLHACGLPAATGGFEDVTVTERGLLSVGRSIAREAVQRVRSANASVAVRTVVTMGNPATALVEASELADMLVVGARGRGSVSSALLGSVSAVVAREAQCPVVVVRGVEPAPDAVLPVVVGVDGTQASSAALELAFRMASARRLPLTLLHATRDPRERESAAGGLVSHAAKVDLDEEQERLVAEAVTGLCEKFPDVLVTETYLRGDPVRTLVAASRRASLVVVGSRGRRLLTTSLLGSVSRGVVERAACPVAVTRP
jgi:nucleotide-binding universal stress UspA family protein